MLPRARSALLLALLTLPLGPGCGKKKEPGAFADAPPRVVLDAARERPVAGRVQSRFTVKLRSDQLNLAGSTGGGLVLDRPGRARLDIFGPLGSALVSLASDGGALVALLPREKRHLTAPSADEVIREASGGVAGIDDVLAVLQGDLPFDGASTRDHERLGEGKIRVVLDGPEKTEVRCDLDVATGTPVQLVAWDRKKQEELLTVRYGAFEAVDGELFPTEVVLGVPSLDLVVELRYKGWKKMEQAPDVFSLPVPDGITTEPLVEIVRGLVEDRAEPPETNRPPE